MSLPVHSVQNESSSDSSETFLSKNLLSLLSKNNITESDLARTLKLPYNSIHRLVTGYIHDPRLSTLKLIADYFDVTIDALTEADDPMNFREAKGKPRCVPILSWTDITNPHFLDEIDYGNYPNWQPIIPNSVERLSEQAYALESRRSMYPRFLVGSMFIVDPKETPMDGDLVLVRILENNAVSLRELVIDPPTWNLMPVIEDSAPISYNEKYHEIIGIIVLTIMQTRK